ncbi:MAG: B12-binding domain-containing radical SAM protein [Candidatus Omnitrophica bacterium]|nr:B12-binding domain-containing radical SAM protein [Candidatus Omnitrophota bacterium]
MKITFIEPRSTGANVYSRISIPLLGPLYLGTILKKRGHTVEIYKENIFIPDYSKLDSDIIGISMLTSTAKRGYEIAKKFPKERVIMGGSHASLMPEEAIKFARQVVIGEADSVIADVIEGKNTSTFVQGSPIDNLDELPFPDFSLIKGARLPLKITPISTSRGCPYNCNFCSVTKFFGRNYRFRSAQSVISEIISNAGKFFFFCDDNFAANTKRTKELLCLMIKNKIHQWSCQVRTDIANDDELLWLMAKAGCRYVCVGFESINQKTLLAYQKRQSVSQIKEAIRAFHKHRIKVHGMFVLGSDEDSEKTVWETLKFSLRQKIDTIQFMILTPLPGTEVYNFLEAQKRIFTKDWGLYDGHHVVFKPKRLTAKQLQTSVFRAYGKFYSLFRSLALFMKFHFRNALFRFMGYRLVKKWKRQNINLPWLIPSSYQ